MRRHRKRSGREFIFNRSGPFRRLLPAEVRAVQPWLDKAVEMIRPDSLLVSRIDQQYGLSYYRQMDWNKAIEYYSEAYRYNPEFI